MRTTTDSWNFMFVLLTTIKNKWAKKIYIFSNCLYDSLKSTYNSLAGWSRCFPFPNPANIYLLTVDNRTLDKHVNIFKVNNKDIRRHVVFIVNFVHISYLFLVFLTLVDFSQENVCWVVVTVWKMYILELFWSAFSLI